MTNHRQDLIFISYAREDADKVHKIYEKLKERGLNLWLDEVNIKPGYWKTQTQKAIARSRYFLIFLSIATLRKTGEYPGFVDKELNEAYNIALKQDDSTFTIIPLRLENCERGDHRLTIFQQYDLFPESKLNDKLDKIAVSLGGYSLSDSNIQDKRSEDEQLIESMLTKIETLIYANDLEKADKLINSILEIYPQNPEAYYLRACIFESRNKFEQAIENYSHAVKLNPNYAKVFNNRGFAYQKVKKVDEAIKDYMESIRLNPNEAIAYFNLGYLYGEQGKIFDMLENFTIAIKLNPNFALAYKNRGVYYLKNDDIEKCLKDLTEVIRISPKDPEGFKYRGEAKFALQDLKGALADFNEAIKLSKKYRGAYFKRALVREDIGDLHGAIKDYTEVIRLEPTAIAYINRALIFRKMEETEKVYADCEAALELDQDDPEANKLLESLETVEITKKLFQGSELGKKIRWK